MTPASTKVLFNVDLLRLIFAELVPRTASVAMWRPFKAALLSDATRRSTFTTLQLVSRIWVDEAQTCLYRSVAIQLPDPNGSEKVDIRIPEQHLSKIVEIYILPHLDTKGYCRAIRKRAWPQLDTFLAHLTDLSRLLRLYIESLPLVSKWPLLPNIRRLGVGDAHDRSMLDTLVQLPGLTNLHYETIFSRQVGPFDTGTARAMTTTMPFFTLTSFTVVWFEPTTPHDRHVMTFPLFGLLRSIAPTLQHLDIGSLQGVQANILFRHCRFARLRCLHLRICTNVRTLDLALLPRSIRIFDMPRPYPPNSDLAMDVSRLVHWISKSNVVDIEFHLGKSSSGRHPELNRVTICMMARLLLWVFPICAEKKCFIGLPSCWAKNKRDLTDQLLRKAVELDLPEQHSLEALANANYRDAEVARVGNDEIVS